MRKQLDVRNFIILTVISVSSLVSGCADAELPMVSETNAASLAVADDVVRSPSISDGQKMYHVMAAEMYRLQGDDANATLHYERALPGNTDPELARVATETAAQTEYLDKAIASAKQWVALGGDLVESRQYLALLLLRDNQFDASAKQLNHIYQLISEGDHDGLSFLASLISLESHQKQAFKAFETYVKSYNDTPLAQLKLASVALDQRSYSEVISRVDALKGGLTPEENAEANVLRSKALYKQGREEESLDVMSNLVTSPDVDDVSRLEYARLLMLNDDQQGAIDQLSIIYQNSPGNLEVLKSLVALHIAQGQYVQAEKNARILAENVVYENLAHHFLAEIHESRNEMDAALREYRDVGEGQYFSSAQRRISELLVEQYSLDIAEEWLQGQRESAVSPDQKLLYWRLEAELLVKYGDAQGAVGAFEKAYQIDPNNSNMNYQFAIIAQSIGQIERAEDLLAEIIVREPANADALNALGFMLLEKTDRLEDAAAYISKAHELRPEDVAIIDSLGWLKYKQGDLKGAMSLLMSAYEQSEDPEIASHLIQVMIMQGQQQEAKALLVRMIQQYPDDERLKSMQKKIFDI
ncbi:tetratricopeptide repeat protein [Leucothrix pacifica]|uniref:Cytochrome c-type biogenesis protein H TPR domain-containing protein n=1 Tax=Leucothrix pacifica TaxID=1247513 RepID=A0A317CKZ4_9GAMM|nr:tetratricopeptide repeat protein [Leucothrix pacifica]PWQ99166.1 hypothetical protein DKW60_06975 [Leucothrix pacifica]